MIIFALSYFNKRNIRIMRNNPLKTIGFPGKSVITLYGNNIKQIKHPTSKALLYHDTKDDP